MAWGWGASTIGAVLMLVLSGCAAPPAEPQTPSATAVSSPSPSPSPVAPVVAVPAFGGVCENAFDLSEVDALTGDTGSEFMSPPVPVQRLGGLVCRVLQDRSLVQLTVLPRSVVPTGEEFSAGTTCVDSPEPVCSTTRVVGDVWIGTTVDSYALQAQSDPIAALDAFVDRIADRAAGFPSPVAAERTPEWWSVPPSCDVLFSETGLADALGPTFEPGYPGGGTSLSSWVTVLESSGGYRSCDWYQGLGQDESHPYTIRIVALPGSSASAEQLAAELGGSLEPIDVPGADDAVLAIEPIYLAEGVIVVARSGPNLLQVWTREVFDEAPRDVDETVAIAAALLARLKAQP